MIRCSVVFLAAVLSAAPPVLTDLQPRGAQKGRPFTLTLSGRELGEVIRIHSNLPAAFTALAPERQPGMMSIEGRYASFLVEPKGEWKTGVYTIRLETADGISNVQLFSIGDFPELTESEASPGARPAMNDSIESAESLPASAVTVTGTLRGPERDFYRVQGKLGERRVIELEGRRIGSAIDPVLRVYDASGKQLAKSEDHALLGLDARVDLKFPRDGYYYIEVHDARFSNQTANFYRLKTGVYDYPTDLYPLGGQRGQAVDVSLGAAAPVKVDLAKAEAGKRLSSVALPNSPSLPLAFDVGDFPEVREPVASPLALPVTINGKISKAAEIDTYWLNVTPGQKLMIEVRARDLGTSKLMAIVNVEDEKGKRLARSGDEPLPEDFYQVGGTKTANDPYVFFEVPAGVARVKLTLEDLARRGGTHFAYRVVARPAQEEFTVNVNTPFVNIPAGGTAFVPVSVDRRGYMGPVKVRVKNPPAGLIVEGGSIPAQPPNSIQGNRGFVRAGGLFLSAKAGVRLPVSELIIEGVGQLPDGREILARGAGLGFAVGVNGATNQGAVDRQRAVSGAWLGWDLPAAGTSALPVKLELTLEKTVAKDVGFEFYLRWKFSGSGVEFPASVSSDMISAQDTRAIEMMRDPKDPSSGTFTITTTKLTQPADYDLYILGRVTVLGQSIDVYSRPLVITVKEVTGNASTVSEAR